MSLFGLPVLLFLAVFLVSAPAAHAQAPAPNVCPAVGANSNCGTVLTILNIGDGKGNCPAPGCVSIQNNQGPYDGNDDTLVGVVNNSLLPVSSITLSSGTDIFGFDGDGLCAYIPCSWPHPTGYEGPGTVFSPTSSSAGVVNFSPAIPPSGGTAYFSLENALSSATACTSLINNSVTQSIVGGTGITALFKSKTIILAGLPTGRRFHSG